MVTAGEGEGRAPLLNRQRIFLRLAQLLREKKICTKTALVKMLFLLRKEYGIGELVPFYSFYPYKFGPFSQLFYYDLRRLGADGFLTEQLPTKAGMEEGKKVDGEIDEKLKQVASRFNTQRKLMEYVYSNYPDYTVKSELKHSEAKKSEPGFFTIGYENQNIDSFLDTIIHNGIDTLVDVRYNPFSMNFAFTENKLRDYLSNVDVDYVNFRSLGIPGDKRGNLRNSRDYRKLFAYYARWILPKNRADFEKLVSMGRKKRMAIMCFEKDVECCHRGIIAQEIEKKGFEVVHL